MIALITTPRFDSETDGEYSSSTYVDHGILFSCREFADRPGDVGHR